MVIGRTISAALLPFQASSTAASRRTRLPDSAANCSARRLFTVAPSVARQARDDGGRVLQAAAHPAASAERRRSTRLPRRRPGSSGATSTTRLGSARTASRTTAAGEGVGGTAVRVAVDDLLSDLTPATRRLLDVVAVGRSAACATAVEGVWARDADASSAGFDVALAELLEAGLVLVSSDRLRMGVPIVGEVVAAQLAPAMRPRCMSPSPRDWQGWKV
jgi:hypothetical protein